MEDGAAAESRRNRLVATSQLLRTALDDRRARQLPSAARIVEQTLADMERALMCSNPPARLLERQIVQGERILAVWEALLDF